MGAFGFGLGALGDGASAAETYLGLTMAQIASAVVGGQSLAQIATAHGKTADGLVQGWSRGGVQAPGLGDGREAQLGTGTDDRVQPDHPGDSARQRGASRGRARRLVRRR